MQNHLLYYNISDLFEQMVIGILEMGFSDADNFFESLYISG